MIARREAPRNQSIDSSTKDIHGWTPSMYERFFVGSTSKSGWAPKYWVDINFTGFLKI